MAYGVLYEFRRTSTNGADMLITISQKDYNGAVKKRALGRAPVIKRENNGHIYGTSCELYAECLVDGEFSHLYTSDAYEYKVEVYKNNTLIWMGYVSPELYSEPDIAPPYDVQIIATDGLGELKNYNFEKRGVASILDHLDTLMDKTGIETSWNIVSGLHYIKEDGVASLEHDILNVKLDLDHEEGNSCYDVLQGLLSSLNANITQHNGRYLIFRETDFISKADYAGVEAFDETGSRINLPVALFGTMKSNQWWPVGQLSTVIEPAKNHLTLKSPNHYKENILSFSDWTMSELASYSEFDNAYVLPGADSAITQTINFGHEVGYRLGLRVRARNVGEPGDEEQNIGIKVEVDGRSYSIGSSFWLVKSANSSGRPINDYLFRSAEGYIEEDLPTPTDGATSSDAQDIDIVLPLHTSGSRSYVYARNIKLTIFNPTGLYDIYVYDVSLVKYEQIKGYEANVIVENMARESESDIDLTITAGDLAPAAGNVFMTGLPMRPSDSEVITKWQIGLGQQQDYLATMAFDYARAISLPRMKYSGMLNVPGSATFLPTLFLRDGTYYFPKTYSYDLYADEITVDLISISAADVSLSSVQIIQISDAAGTMGATTGGPAGGGSGGGASNLKDLQDVKLNATASGDLLYFNGSTWINSNIHNIITSYLDLQKKLGDWFYLTEDGKSIGTRFNLFSEGEVSGNGLSLGEGGGGSSDGGLITSVLNTSYLGAALINSDDTVFNAYATNEIYKVTQAHDSRISILESQVGDLMVGSGSKVTVSNLLTTGTRVATITIDGTAYNIFAPVGEGGSIDTSAFLPITGGTIQGGSNVTPFVINSDSASQSNPQSGMRFSVSGASKGWMGYSGWYGCHFFNYVTGDRLGIRDNGTPYFSPTDGEYKTLLHSGNYTDYTVGTDGTGAYGTWKISITGAVGGHEPAAFFLRYTREDGAMDLNTLHQGKSVFCEIRTGEVTTTNCPFTGYGALLSMRDYSGASQTGFAKMQIAANSTSAWIRAQQGGDVAISSAWNQLAFVTSNVASATKLETARTLWGQKFDGSANVTGNLRIGDGYLYLNNNKGMYAYDASGVATYVFGLDSSNTYLFAHGQYHSKVRGKTVTMTYGVSHTTGLILNASGNVTIGGSDLASTNYKLYVNGSSYVGGNIVASGEISANVLNQGSDIRFKDRIEDVALSLDKITNAPVFRFRWNDRKDDRVYVGTSAQYWKEHIAELVSVNGEGFHKLDYSTLGVIIGVTLGKVVKNHEERISEIERRLKHECK